MTTETWVLILLAALVVAAILWLILRPKGTGTPDSLDRTTAERRIDEAEAEAPAAPIIVGPAVSPLDVAPPPVPAVDDARVIETEPAAAVEPAGPPDELTLIKGLGPKLQQRLAELGITRFDQIAAWSDADVDRIDAQLGAFKGRPTRDRWIDQARLLSQGDRRGFEGEFGKIDPAA